MKPQTLEVLKESLQILKEAIRESDQQSFLRSFETLSKIQQRYTASSRTDVYELVEEGKNVSKQETLSVTLKVGDDDDDDLVEVSLDHDPKASSCIGWCVYKKEGLIVSSIFQHRERFPEEKEMKSKAVDELAVLLGIEL